MDLTPNPEDREMLKEFEKAHAIANLIRQPGFQFLIDILKQEYELDEARLLTLPQGSDPHIVNSCLIAAQISRSKFERLQLRLDSALDFTRNLQTQNNLY